MLKAPPMQTATATIDTLCGRLESAALLEDRRAAILGLRSFAKQYPASVASGSLRELITTLKRDGLGETSSSKTQDGELRRGHEGGDVDTIRLVLETLLMLFNPDSSSPEAGEEIAFFLADEFSMRQDNIIMLLSLLDPTSAFADYYSRLYAVQLLSAICASRPERLQECVLSAPLGISRLVGVLDDTRDAVRNAGLLLLVDLTSGANEDLRKIVAFEDVFGRIFSLIQLEGGLAEAGITAQDCLSLLANLIRGSGSNQTMFRESGCIAQLVHLLTQAFPQADSEAAFVARAREKAAWGLLQLLRLFLVRGEISTAQNQTALFRAGAAQVLIDLGFHAGSPIPIRTSALKSAAALIEANPLLQEQFAALVVISVSDAEYNAEQAMKSQQLNGTRPKSAMGDKSSARPSSDKRSTYIIEALLELSLSQPQTEQSLRAASCNLIQAYLTGHERIQAHFLQRAVTGHAEQETDANVLSTLLHPPSSDVFAVVYASWILQDLVIDNFEAKTALAAVREGNENEGEDVLTAIQLFGTQLHSSFSAPMDERFVAAYASLLTTLLWDFAAGVDELLSEGSSLTQALVGLVKSPTDFVVTGLAAVLLGTIYEFSTKDSPIPRRTLAPLLQEQLGRMKYHDALLQFRRQPAIRDFDLNLETDDVSNMFLSRVFIELFAVEYSRLRNAIDKDPGLEVIPASAMEAGVDRDVLDDLRQRLQTAEEALAHAQKEIREGGQKAEQDRLTIGKELQTANIEVERLRKINQAIQQGHEREIEKIERQHEQQRQTLETRHKHTLADAKKEAEAVARTALRESEAKSLQKIEESEKRIAEISNAHRLEANGHASVRQQLELITAQHSETTIREKNLQKQMEEIQRKYAKAEQNLEIASSRALAAESKLEIVKNSFETRGEEVDGLKLQLDELREELKGRDEELKAERAGFAELEKELEATKEALSAAEKKVAAVEAKQEDGEAPTAKTTAHSKKAEKEKLQKLEAELEEARTSEKSAKEELESMLLVMSDIESAKDKYKTKVQELGGEVSDDEEDEGGEEDEEVVEGNDA